MSKDLKEYISKTPKEEYEIISIKNKNKIKSSYFNKNEDFFYHETENYKNYKYKLYNIDIEEIARKKLMGKKIAVSDYNYPYQDFGIKNVKNHQKLLISPDKYTLPQDFHSEKLEIKRERIAKSPPFHKPNKNTLMTKINKISLDLKVENSKKQEKPNENKPNEEENVGKKENPDENKSKFPIIDAKPSLFQKQDYEKLLSERLMGILNQRKNDSSLSKNEKNGSLPKIEQSIYKNKKIGGGYSLKVKKTINNSNMINNSKAKNNKSIALLFEESFSKHDKQTHLLNEKINLIVSQRKIKKKAKTISKTVQKNKRNNYEEFISLSQQGQQENYSEQSNKYVSLKTLRENFEIFKNNPDEINYRILLALGVSEINDENSCKIYWDSFSKFMKLFVNKESTVLEIVSFLCKFFVIEEKQKKMPIQDFLSILKTLALKLGEGNNACINLFNLYVQLLHALGLINEKNNQIIIDDFRQALLNNDIKIKDLLALITSKFC